MKNHTHEMHCVVKSDLQRTAVLRYEEDEIYSTSISHKTPNTNILTH